MQKNLTVTLLPILSILWSALSSLAATEDIAELRRKALEEGHKGHVKECRQILDKIIQSKDVTAEDFCGYAETYLAVESTESGIAVPVEDKLKRALQLDPQSGHAYALLAKYSNVVGNYPKAVEFANKALTVKKPSDMAFRERALAYSHLGKSALALADIDQSLKLHPYFYSYVIKGGILESLHKYAEAADTYSMAMKKATGYHVMVFSKLISCLRKAGKNQEALDTLSARIKSQPEGQAEYFEQRGQIEQEMKKYNEALFDLTKAIEIQPTRKYYKERADLYTLLQRPADAQKDLQQVKKLDSSPLENLF